MTGIPDGPIDREPIGFRPRDEQEATLHEVLATAGVDLGAYDAKIVAWVAGWERSTVAVIASWVQRAGPEAR